MIRARAERICRPLRLVLVTNIPAPYRIPVYELMDAEPDIALTVLYCAGREPDRHWGLRRTPVRSLLLRGTFWTVGGRFNHLNPGLYRTLVRERPDVVITTGYNPTHLMAVLYAFLHRVPHVVQTDGTDVSERSLSSVHRLVRRLVRRASQAFVGASEGSLRLFRSYGVTEDELFRSPLAVDNDRFVRVLPKTHDLVFSGRLNSLKNPLFALEVAERAAARLGRRVSMSIAGTGPLLDEVLSTARRLVDVDVTVHGFLEQDQLENVYAAARLLLFPTGGDAWGIVVNEACAAGVPVLTSPHAGVADELVLDGVNGRVLPLDTDQWVDAVVELLQDEPTRYRLGLAARRGVAAYTYRAAADGLIAAVRAVAERPIRRRVLIDALGAPQRSGGMRLHATEVLQSWLSRWGDDDDVVVVGPPWIKSVDGIERASRIVLWPNDNPVIRAVGQQLITPLAYRLTRRQFLLATNSVLSPFVPRSSATVVAHDWRHALHPKEFSRSQRLYRRWWRNSARRAGRVVTVSDKTRAESLRLLGRTDIVTVENGRDHTLRWASEAIAPKVAPEAAFIVTFGHHTNKRPELVVEALLHVADPSEVVVVVLGAQGPMKDSLSRLAVSLSLTNRVVLPGFVSEVDYRWFITNALVVVVASSDEGFGLPLAEAAALGVPAVVASDSGVAALFHDTAVPAEPTPEGLGAAIDQAVAGPKKTSPGVGSTWAEAVDRLRSVVLRTDAGGI